MYVIANTIEWNAAVVYLSHPGGRQNRMSGDRIKNKIAIITARGAYIYNIRIYIFFAYL